MTRRQIRAPWRAPQVERRECGICGGSGSHARPGPDGLAVLEPCVSCAGRGLVVYEIEDRADLEYEVARAEWLEER